jgi:hypothetical protein
MTKDELQELIESSLETKLRELLCDPDEGLELKKVVRDRLLRQKKAVAAGERGEPLNDVVRRLGWHNHAPRAHSGRGGTRP